jgi:hypothetical protein
VQQFLLYIYTQSPLRTALVPISTGASYYVRRRSFFLVSPSASFCIAFRDASNSSRARTTQGPRTTIRLACPSSRLGQIDERPARRHRSRSSETHATADRWVRWDRGPLLPCLVLLRDRAAWTGTAVGRARGGCSSCMRHAAFFSSWPMITIHEHTD